MTYDQQILQVLTDADDRGLSAQAISRHVYNRNNTFFNAPDYDEIRTCVRNFLTRHKKSRSGQPLIVSTGKRGCYRLNTAESQEARQLVLQFRELSDEEEETEEEPARQQDNSPGLFDDVI